MRAVEAAAQLCGAGFTLRADALPLPGLGVRARRVCVRVTGGRRRGREGWGVADVCEEQTHHWKINSARVCRSHLLTHDPKIEINAKQHNCVQTKHLVNCRAAWSSTWLALTVEDKVETGYR